MKKREVILMYSILQQGGTIIYPLLFISIVALAIILERFFKYYRIPKEIPDDFMIAIKENIRLNKKNEALKICNDIKNPIGEILKKGIYHLNDGVEEMYQQMDEAKLHEFPKYERHLGLLNFIGKISPTMGLLGTVTGMIKTFHYLSLNVEAQQLAEGISEALITTAFGLIISIPSLGAYYYFISKFEQMVTHTEKREIELTNYIRKSGVSYEKISS